VVKMLATPGPDPSIRERWLLVRMPNDSGATLICRSGATVREVIDAALERVRLPQYLNASVRIAGTDLISSNLLRVLVRTSGGKGSGMYWRWDNPKEPPPVLSPQVSSAEELRLTQQARTRIEGAERLVSQLDPRRLDREQQDTLATIKDFLTKSKEAMATRDLQRAYNLADKAYILVEDLSRGR